MKKILLAASVLALSLNVQAGTLKADSVICLSKGLAKSYNAAVEKDKKERINFLLKTGCKVQTKEVQADLVEASEEGLTKVFMQASKDSMNVWTNAANFVG